MNPKKQEADYLQAWGETLAAIPEVRAWKEEARNRLAKGEPGQIVAEWLAERVGAVVIAPSGAVPRSNFATFSKSRPQGAAAVNIQLRRACGRELGRAHFGARGGAVVALRRELALPIRFVGLGESLDDLEPFDPERFAAGLLGEAA